MRKFIGYGKELTFSQYVHDYIMRPDNGVTKDDIAALLKENGVDFLAKESKKELYEKARKLLGTTDKLTEHFNICVDGEYYLGAFPFLTKADLKRLVKFGAIKIDGYKYFYSYGGNHRTPRYDLKQYLGMTEEKMKRLLTKYPKGMRLPEDENDPAVIAKKEEQKKKRQESKEKKSRMEQERAEEIRNLNDTIRSTTMKSIQSCKEMLRLLTMQAPSEKLDIETICLDIETTGLSQTDEILQISIIDGESNVLMDEYFRPLVNTSWEEAQSIHHISPEVILEIGKPPYEICGRLKSILESANLVIGYNVGFDLGFIKDFFGIDILEKSYDVMKDFSPIYGEYSEYYGDFKFQSLETCASFFDYKWNGGPHSALEDAKATLFCYNAIQNISEDEADAIRDRNDQLVNIEPL